MRYDLLALARRARNPRRRSVTLRDIVPPATLATNLYLSSFKPIIDLWTRITPRIAAEYERSLSSLTTDAPSDLSNILDEAEAELTRLLLVLRPALRNWLVQVERWQRGKWIGAVLAASGVDLTTLIGPEDARETLDMVLERNVGLIKDISAQARQRISTAVFEGLRARSPARDVGKAIVEATGMAKRRAVNVAADQLTKTTSALASERRRQAGLDKWEWRSSHKLHFRPEHAARDGKVYSDEDAPADLPGQLPYCGCRERAVLSFE